jgi:nucleoid-associated protein YgaU
VLVTGLLGALGWVGYQQISASPAKADAAANEEPLLLEGETAGGAEMNLAFARPKATQAADKATSVESSPFDAPQSFRRAPDPVKVAETPVTEGAANPFAAFAPKQTAMAPVDESPFAQTPPLATETARSADAGSVTLASNEAPAPGAGAVEIFEVGGQSEPGTPANAVPEQSEPQPNAGNDPFAAFAPQSAPAAEAPSSVPAPFGTRPQAQQVVADAEWATAPQAVTPVQFNSEQVQIPAPAQFEPEAKPIGSANEFATEPVPALNRAPATADWPPFEQQPATMEPKAPARRMNPQPAYSPDVEPAQTTSFNVPQPAAPANDPRDERLHVVQQGETFWSIARQHYGAGRYFQALAEYNKPRISDQAALKPGMKVLVPSATTLDTRYGKLMQASGLAKPPAKPHAGLRVDPQGRSLYVVGEGDTLGEIARRYLGKTSRQDEICRMNQEQLPNPNKLKAGMILVMPDDAVEVQPASSIPGRR